MNNREQTHLRPETSRYSSRFGGRRFENYPAEERLPTPPKYRRAMNRLLLPPRDAGGSVVHRGTPERYTLTEGVMCQFFDFHRKWWGCAHCVALVKCESPRECRSLFRHLHRSHGFGIVRDEEMRRGRMRLVPKLFTANRALASFVVPENDNWPPGHFARLAAALASEDADGHAEDGFG